MIYIMRGGIPLIEKIFSVAEGILSLKNKKSIPQAIGFYFSAVLAFSFIALITFLTGFALTGEYRSGETFYEYLRIVLVVTLCIAILSYREEDGLWVPYSIAIILASLLGLLFTLAWGELGGLVVVAVLARLPAKNLKKIIIRFRIFEGIP